MRVLVTGGAGFTGSFTVDELAARGHEVRILDNLSPQVHPAGRPDWINPRAELIVADVRSRPALTAALADIDAVVHCAGAVGVAQSQYEIGHYTSVNVHGTGVLLECLAEQRSRWLRLVVPTSMTGYGEGQYERLSDGAQVRVAVRTEEDVRTNGWEPVCHATGAALRAAPTSEDAALLARNVYALTKRHQEELALAVGGYDGELAARGLLVVAGAGASPSPGQVGGRIESGPPTRSGAGREAGGSQA